jgi:murein DD-endopeptidase MepM/ murein hydrolase activator NlpD
MKMSYGIKAFNCSAILLMTLLLAAAGGSNDADHEPIGGAAGSASQLTMPSSGRTELVPLRIKLPFPEGMRFEVYQGNDGSFSHDGLNEFAWDFGLPKGTSVCAAAQGRVVRVKQDSDTGGLSREDFALANTVVLDHGNGFFTQYLHLKKNSVRVAEGDIVQAGEVIAQSGNTGFSSIPHLHFQVQDATGQSLPAAFLDVPGNGIPAQGRVYTSGNDGLGVSHYAGVSPLPLNAFVRNSVLLSNTDIPGHLLHVNQSYHIEGTVRRNVAKVAIYLMKASGGHAITSFFATVDSQGRFHSTLDFSDIMAKAGINWSKTETQSNTFALAVCPVEPDGSYWSNYSVPITLR